MDDGFLNKVKFEIPLPGDNVLQITDTVTSTWIIGGILIIFALIVRMKLKGFTLKPKTKFQNIVEFMVEMFHKFTVENMGPKYEYFGNWFFGIMLFIAASNLSGLIALRPPTADLACTATLGITTFFIIHFMGIKTGKAKYFKDYISPTPLFLPLNLIGELAIPISLSFRLFGNIFGGVMIMNLLYSLFPVYLKIGIPAALHIYFDVFAGCLQAFVFVILSMTFIRNKIND